MSLTTRTLADIRDDLIAATAVSDPDINTADGSDAWITANAEAGLLAELQARDVELSRATLPTLATGSDLDEHARVWLGDDNGRQAATQWFGTITLTRIGSATPVVASGTALTAADGTAYETTEGVAAADWSAATITVDAKSTDEHVGTTGNKAVSTPLTVTTPPAGLSSSAVIASTTTGATDEETDEHLRERILDVTNGLPGAGNCSNYVVWAKSVSGCSEAFVYPRWDGFGTVQVVIQGPAGDRVPSATIRQNVEDYIETVRPCGVVVTVSQPSISAGVGIQADIRLASGYEPGWTGTLTTAAAAHTTTRVFTTVDPTGTVHIGDWIVVPIGAADFSCCRQVTNVQNAYLDVSAVFEDEDGIATAPAAAGGETIRPGFSIYQDLWDAVNDTFEATGPSGTVDHDYERYPYPADSWCPHVFQSDIIAALESVEGVIGVDLTLPAANQINQVAHGSATKYLEAMAPNTRFDHVALDS